MNERPGIGDGGGELSEIRRKMIELAAGAEGLNAGTDPAGYIALVGPTEEPQMQHDMLLMSGCALVVRGLWRWAGIEHPILQQAYVQQHAMSDLVMLASMRGAWCEAAEIARGVFPKPGDAVILGKGTPVEHTFTVLGIRVVGSGLVQLCSMDGGWRDGKRNEMVSRFDRTWAITGPSVSTPGVAFDAVAAPREPGMPMHPVRRVSGWIDLDALFAGQ